MTAMHCTVNKNLKGKAQTGHFCAVSSEFARATCFARDWAFGRFFFPHVFCNADCVEACARICSRCAECKGVLVSIVMGASSEGGACRAACIEWKILEVHLRRGDEGSVESQSAVYSPGEEISPGDMFCKLLSDHPGSFSLTSVLDQPPDVAIEGSSGYIFYANSRTGTALRRSALV